jgi:mannose-6-phosphate isomerase-like protein (cupin superfamily)
MRTEKPWGYEDLISVNDKYVMKRLFMKAGHSCSLQFHEQKHETVYVVKGTLNVSVGESIRTLRDLVMHEGDHLILEPGVVHRMTAIEDCIYLEASTPELQDVVRLEDNYGRA